MKQFNDITIIGIDQGYGNMKTANTIFPTAITAYDTAPMFKGDVLEYGGRFYRMGEGHKGFVADKSADGDFYLLTLAAIAKELEQYRLFTANLCLAVGLPLSWVGSQRESFRQYLMQNETVSFRFNGNPFQLRIVSCKVYPQGYAAIVQQLADFEGEHLLADIGNGTMNLLYLTDSQPQENRCWTEKIGVSQCMIRAKEAVLRRFGSKISDSAVEQILRTGTAKIDADYIALMGQDIGSFKSWQRIGYVPQDGLTRKASFPASVNEVVLANLYSRIGLFRFPRREHREDVRRTLELVGMQDYGCRMLGELSGGQRQRVQLAQALVSRPALLLLDEPTAGLDAQSTADFYTLLKNLNRERGLSILIVSHDLQEMPRLTDTIYCLSHQKITRLAAKEIRTYV